MKTQNTTPPKPSASNRPSMREIKPGILDRIAAAATIKEVDKLEGEIGTYQFASSKTLNKFGRLARDARARLGASSKNTRTSKSRTPAA